ncbi:hypothetical protein C8R44DRAFT_725091 [Mycena epipterygia]|nr:hypothetical protein C8R44DRAFT_725091 [Mycena epipterygia]
MALRNILNILWLALALTARSMVTHEHRLTLPAGFVSHGLAFADATIPLHIALAAKFAGLEDKPMSLSSLGSPEFGKWLSKEQANQPSPETISAFGSVACGAWLSITLPISQANELFAAQFECLAPHYAALGNLAV